MKSSTKSVMKDVVKNILIVDDLPMARTALRNILSQLRIPCVCYEANDGLEGLRYLAHESIDLVLLDWIMPFLTGIEFLKKARALGADMPIIMVTGEADVANVKEAMLAGITDYIIKPVIPEVLRDKLIKLDSFKDVVLRGVYETLARRYGPGRS